MMIITPAKVTHRVMSGLLVGSLVILAWPLSGSTAQTPTAKRFMNGGTFCFSLKQAALPQWRETLKLVVQPTPKGRAQQLPLISGLQHGVLVDSSPYFEYISQWTGTASYTLDRNGLMVSLTSNEAGVDLSGVHPGIWLGNMALTLDATHLTGLAIGTKIFKPVENGKVGEPPYFEDAVDGQISPMDCKNF